MSKQGAGALPQMFKRLKEESSGQTLIVFALALSVLLSFLALAIDGGMLRYQKRVLQNAADASALAGALEVSTCNGTANCSAMQLAARNALSENGLPGSSLLLNCATRTGTSLEISVNNAPCAVSTDPNIGNSAYVEVLVSRPVATTFARLFGVKSVLIMARGEAGLSGSPCVYLLSIYSTQPSLSVGNQTVQSACTYYLGSSYVMTGGASSSGSPFLVAGSASNSSGSVTPTPTFGVPARTDPLSRVLAPTVGSCTYTNRQITAAAALIPGVYCGGLTIKTSATVTLAAGTYIILGALTIDGPTMTGSGVTFYVSQGNGTSAAASSIQNVNATLSAPTSGSLQGILYFADRSISAGSATLSLANWNSGTRLDGILYLSGQELIASNVTLRGTQYFGVVADYMSMHNTAFMPSTNYSSLTGGNPFASAGSAVLVE